MKNEITTSKSGTVISREKNLLMIGISFLVMTTVVLVSYNIVSNMGRMLFSVLKNAQTYHYGRRISDKVNLYYLYNALRPTFNNDLFTNQVFYGLSFSSRKND